MDGLRADEGFKPHHRIATGKELLKRGFDYECAHDQPSDDTQPASAIGHATPETDSTVIPAKAGESDAILNILYMTDSETEEPVDYVAMAKEIEANLDPSEFEDEPPTDHKPSYAMWDIIRKQPRPVITEEHQRIAMARFNKRMELQRLWEESDVKIPDPPEGLTRYDDG